MDFKKKYFPFILLLAVFFIVELFIDPRGEFGLNDDWAYAKTVYHWDKHGEFLIGIWPAMSLYSHALLGLIFTKLFGFSFTVLRFANMLLCLVTLFHLYKFFCKKNKATVSAIACAFIIFNPFYLNIFNSFMTDLSFFNYSFLAFYYLNDYFSSRKWYFLLLFFLFAILAMLTRQLGILLFVAFIAIEVFNFRKAIKYSWIAPICAFVGGLIILYIFEKFQFSRFKPGSSYQGIFLSPAKFELGPESVPRMFNKTFMILKNSGLWLSLFLLMILPTLKERIKGAKKHVLGIVVLIFICYLFKLIKDHSLGDIIINLGVGIESTVDMLMIYATDLHATNNFFFFFLMVLFYLGYLLFGFFIGSTNLKKIKEQSFSKQFLIAVLILYLSLIGLADSSFDRYCIFFGLFLIVFIMSDSISYTRKSLMLSLIVFSIVFCFSVFATKDYFTAAHLKKEILTELAVKDKVEPQRVNAGFEYQIWDQTDSEINWLNWDHLDDKIYIVSRQPIKEYELYKTYTYQRFVPLRTDTFFVVKKKN